jgi:hypothetical protein
MKRIRLHSAVGIIIAAGIILSSGCIFNPKPDDGPAPVPKIDWKDLTEKEDCITNMLLAYKYKDMTHYQELLMPNKYLWYLQDEDAVKYQMVYLDYNQDLAGTDFIFNNAVMLTLELDSGTWTEIDNVGEEPCENCWDTQRHYTIQFQKSGEEIIKIGNDTVKFVVVPYEDKKDGRMEWRIQWAWDLNTN